MRKAGIFALTALFLSVAAFADTPSVAPLTREALASILGQPAASGSCATQASGALFAAGGTGASLEKSACSATATCASGTISCSGSGTCTAVDRNCSSGERGHVTCGSTTGSTTSWCPTPCCYSSDWCCQCALTEDCFACCRCDGLGYVICTRDCS
jgi:hypothetical protein